MARFEKVYIDGKKIRKFCNINHVDKIVTAYIDLETSNTKPNLSFIMVKSYGHDGFGDITKDIMRDFKLSKKEFKKTFDNHVWFVSRKEIEKCIVKLRESKNILKEP